MSSPERFLDEMRLRLYDVFVAAGVDRGEATAAADSAYRERIGAITTGELLLELGARLRDVRVSAPGTFGDLADVLLAELPGERLVYRTLVP